MFNLTIITHELTQKAEYSRSLGTDKQGSIVYRRNGIVIYTLLHRLQHMRTSL